MKILLHIKHPLLVFFLVIIVGFLGGLVLFEYYFQDRFFPGITIGGDALVGREYADVRSHLDRVGEGLVRDGIELVLRSRTGEKTIVIPAQSIGLTSDVVVEYFSVGNYQEALNQAFERGHTGSLIHRLADQYRLLLHGYEGEYGVTLREDTIRSLVSRELQELLEQPQDAYFSVRAGGVTLVPDSFGEDIDLEAVIAALKTSLRNMKTNRLQVTVRQLPAAVRAEKLGTIKDFANSLSAAGLFKLLYNDHVVYLSGQRLSGWLTVDPSQAGIVIKVRERPLKDFVEEYIDGDLPDAPRNSRFAMVGSRLVEIAAGAPGTVAHVPALSSQLEAILNARYVSFIFGSSGQISGNAQTKEVLVTFKKEYPRITSSTISQYNITELVGGATTSFKGSTASRIKNIQTGVDRASGVLLRPGQEFSLIDAIGEVTEETGFDKEYVIKGDRSIKEAGGGLCQLATTVFRGALNAGLPITERQNHSYIVGYYGPGLDATIYGPHPDLKFRNDTGHYLLFQMRVEGTNLITEMYGTRDDRHSSTTEPVLSDFIDPPPDRYIAAPDKPWGELECTDHPRKGVSAVATTTVTYADGGTRTQVFQSVYQPWPKVCLVGIKTK